MKKKKLIAIIVACVMGLAGLGVGGFFLVRHLTQQSSPDMVMQDWEFLVAHSPWHKLNEDGTRSERLIWTFAADGTGTVTTNGGIDTYDTQWGVSGSTLEIRTKWLYELTDSFSFTTDRELGRFTVVDTEEDKVTTFGFDEAAE